MREAQAVVALLGLDPLGGLVALGELALGTQELWREEVHHRPEIQRPVLDRGSGEGDTELPLEFVGRLGGDRLGVLDVLGFVQDHRREGAPLKELRVAAQDGVGGHDEIAARIARQLAPAAAEVLRAKVGGEALRFSNPVGQHRGGRDHQRGRGLLRAVLLAQQIGQGLHRLSEPHLVGEQRPDAALPEVAQEAQPAKAGDLVRPRLRFEPLRQRLERRWLTGEPAEEPARHGVNLRPRSNGLDQIVQRPGEPGGYLAMSLRKERLQLRQRKQDGVRRAGIDRGHRAIAKGDEAPHSSAEYWLGSISTPSASNLNPPRTNPRRTVGWTGSDGRARRVRAAQPARAAAARSSFSEACECRWTRR